MITKSCAITRIGLNTWGLLRPVHCLRMSRRAILIKSQTYALKLPRNLLLWNHGQILRFPHPIRKRRE